MFLYCCNFFFRFFQKFHNIFSFSISEMISHLLLYMCLTCVAFATQIKNASVTYDRQTSKFSIHDSFLPDAVAVATFHDEIFTTG